MVILKSVASAGLGAGVYCALMVWKRKVHPNLIAASTVSFKHEIEGIWPSGHWDPGLINPCGPSTEQKVNQANQHEETD